jgi:hypothetical protein
MPAARAVLPQSSRSGRGRAGGCAVQRSRPPVRLGQVSEFEARADVHHWRAPRVDRADDLLDVDPLQIHARRGDVRMLDMRVIWRVLPRIPWTALSTS